MPFTKIGTNKYRSPSGKKFTKKQVKAYYATDGFTLCWSSNEEINWKITFQENIYPQRHGPIMLKESWIFKPYIILHHILHFADDDSIVLYVDSSYEAVSNFCSYIFFLRSSHFLCILRYHNWSVSKSSSHSVHHPLTYLNDF